MAGLRWKKRLHPRGLGTVEEAKCGHGKDVAYLRKNRSGQWCITGSGGIAMLLAVLDHKPVCMKTKGAAKANGVKLCRAANANRRK